MAALSDLRLLDLTHVLSGPYATMVMADLGAEVLKIEQPGIGDASRQYGPFIDGFSSYFMSINRRKKSLTLNLQQEKGREILMHLVKSSDILFENYRPGVMEKLGLGYERLKRENPGLIYTKISGYGQTGPLSQKRAYDMIIQGMSGIISIAGESTKAPPIRTAISIGDLSTALFAVLSTLAALYQREKTGQGQFIDISMLDCLVALLENAIARYSCTGEIPQPCGNKHPVITPFQIFPTQDGYITLAIGSDAIWKNLCSTLKKPDLASDSRFKSNALRTENRQALEALLTEIFCQRCTQSWLDDLGQADIPCGPISTIDRVMSNPQLHARNMLIAVRNVLSGEVTVPNSPIELFETLRESHTYAPDLGEHTKEILNDMLGLTEEYIEQLYQEGVL